uniref:Putative secreted protein n=1 Tax=Ixodes ricinus TaxID=34613 RepID=A0A6B0UY16_IXORI
MKIFLLSLTLGVVLHFPPSNQSLLCFPCFFFVPFQRKQDPILSCFLVGGVSFIRPCSQVRVLLEKLCEERRAVGHHAARTKTEGALEVLFFVQHPQVSGNSPLPKVIYQKFSHNEPVNQFKQDHSSQILGLLPHSWVFGSHMWQENFKAGFLDRNKRQQASAGQDEQVQ